MKAIVITGKGGAEVLEIREVPTPEPRGEQVRVRVRACGLNRADLMQAAGCTRRRRARRPTSRGWSMPARSTPWDRTSPARSRSATGSSGSSAGAGRPNTS